MKKFLALLLSLLMLATASSAMATTYRFDLSLALDEEQSAMMAPALSAMFGADVSEEMASALAALVNGAGVVYIWQDDAVSFDLLLGGKSLLDMTISVTNEGIYLTSSLMPEHALFMEADGAVMTDAPVGTDLLTGQFRSTLRFWAKGLRPTVSRGSFSGDAYDGGAVCTTYAFDDADVATLVRGLMSDYILHLLQSTIGDDSVVRFRTATNEMGEKNAYRYLLRVVRDEQDVFAGCSFTVLQGDSQVGTLSVGMRETDAKLVLGLGLPEENYWYDLSAFWTESEDGLIVHGTAHEWLAPGDETYAYAVMSRQPVTRFDWYGNAQQDPVSAALTIADDTSAVTLNLCEAKPILSHHVGKTAVSMSSIDDPLYQQAVGTLTKNLTARLLTIIPLDVLMKLLMPQ